MPGPLSGVERAVFGDAGDAGVLDWLERHVRRRLSAELADVTFRSGRLAAVYGLRLDDGREIVAKIHRAGVNTARLAAATACQGSLATAGYPCPQPLDGPAATDGRVAVLESMLAAGVERDAREPEIRRAIARSLAEHIAILRPLPAVALAVDRPAWAVYDRGPWPVPHDAIFDFRVTPEGFEWLDQIARSASGALGPPGPDRVVGHGDWVCQNMRFAAGAVSAAYDWDSLIGDSEPVLAGLSAGSFTEGYGAPTPDEVAAFLCDYDLCRAAPFTVAEQVSAAAAATWAMAYNARCAVGTNGPALTMLAEHREAYLALRW